MVHQAEKSPEVNTQLYMASMLSWRGQSQTKNVQVGLDGALRGWG